jgi:small acid-soluble spore protein F (minor alpha/beta-type SASP)
MKGYLQTSHWDDVTTGEVGSMVREAIRRGEQAMDEEARANSKAHQNAE